MESPAGWAVTIINAKLRCYERLVSRRSCHLPQDAFAHAMPNGVGECKSEEKSVHGRRAARVRAGASNRRPAGRWSFFRSLYL